MTDYHIGSSKTIRAFVLGKLAAYREMGLSYETLFALMFREEENILYEQSEGYRIRKTTYGTAKEHALRRASALRRRLPSLPRDAVVGLCLDNSLDWIELFWAILAAGFRPLLMNLRLPRPLLEQAMAACGCQAVVAREAFACPTLQPDELGTDGALLPPVPFGTELLVMSSGTTENVKVCAYTAEEFYYQIADSYELIRACPRLKKHYRGELKLLTFLPFYHVFGLIAMYIWFGFFSRTFVHLADLSPQTIVNTVKRHKVTHIFAVPLFWETVCRQARRGIRERGAQTADKFERALALQQRLPRPLDAAFARLAFREVRENLFGESIVFMISGGSFLDPEVQAFFNGIGYRLANGYGMTEIGITSVELSTKKKYLRAGCIGKPMSNAEYRIDDRGELQVRGRVIARYVLCGGERREGGDWYPTRDLAACEDGHYRLLGRADDLIVGPGGENLNPNLIEPMLRTEGAEVCLIAAPKGGRTVPVLLAGVNRHLPNARLEELRAALGRTIAAAGLSGEIAEVALVEGPLMKAGEFKLNRLRLARDWAAGELAPLEPSAARDTDAEDALFGRLRAVFAAAANRPEADISPDSDFFLDLGGTSLDYFAMLTRLRDEYGAAFPLEQTDLRTVGQIADYLRRSAGEGL